VVLGSVSFARYGRATAALVAAAGIVGFKYFHKKKTRIKITFFAMEKHIFARHQRKAGYHRITKHYHRITAGYYHLYKLK